MDPKGLSNQRLKYTSVCSTHIEGINMTICHVTLFSHLDHEFKMIITLECIPNILVFSNNEEKIIYISFVNEYV